MTEMRPYVIKQGDYLTRLAHRLGFIADEVWNHGKNAELKAQRRDPDTLKAGDILFIPDVPKKRNAYTKESENRYVAELPRLPVSLAVAQNGEPAKDAKFVVKGLDEEIEGTTDAEGTVRFEVDVNVREALIELPELKKSYRMLLGDLDPVEEPSGARQRLMQLGYYSATLAGEDQYVAHDEKHLAATLRAFQREQGLEPSGALDKATADALVAAFGA
jgi:hypothetical protein